MGPVVTLKPIGRAWWAAWHRERPTEFIAQHAKRERGSLIAASMVPLAATAVAQLVHVDIRSEAFAACPPISPDRSPVIWMPATMPPATAGGR